MSTSGSEPSTFPYNGLDWCLDHHATKVAERRQMVADVDLRRGDRILDVGSGPGLWAPLFAEKVAPNGHLVELDLSIPYVRYGRAGMADESLQELVSFTVGSFFALPFPDDCFDVAFLANSLSRHANAVDVVREMKRVTRPGGRVILKEFDDGTMVIHPIGARLGASVLQAVTVALEVAGRPGSSEKEWPRYDGFMGRKLRGLLVEAGLDEIGSRGYVIQKGYPLDDAIKRYIQGNASFLGETASPFLDDSDRKAWWAAFDPASDAYVLDRPDFFFCLTEVMATGIVAP